MKIAIIFPLYNHKKFSENLEVVDEEFGVYPPLGPAYAAAILEKAGHEVILIDAKALKLSKRETLSRVKKFNPNLMAFMLTTYIFHQTLSWIRYLKKEVSVPVICGGLNLAYYPKETLSHKEIDYGIIGSARESLPLLVDAIENNKNISKIKGICYRERGKIKLNPPDSFEEDIDKLPFPARHLLPNDKYYQFISKKKNFTIMLTAKGCPYACTFCPIGRMPYSERSTRKVLEEVEECYKNYNVREIDFFAAAFTINKKKVMEFCRGLKNLRKKSIKIDWSCRSRTDTVDEEMLKEMASVGCKRIYYGIESGNPEILKKVNKYIKTEKIKKTIKLTQKWGIKALGFFMIGNPGETKESIEETIRFARKLNLDYVQVMRTIAKPCTNLDDELKEKTGKDYWRDFVLGKEKEKRLPNIWCDLSEEEIDYYLKKMYMGIYINQKYIIKTILRIKSFDELKRYIRAGIKMILK